MSPGRTVRLSAPLGVPALGLVAGLMFAAARLLWPDNDIQLAIILTVAFQWGIATMFGLLRGNELTVSIPPLSLVVVFFVWLVTGFYYGNKYFHVVEPVLLYEAAASLEQPKEYTTYFNEIMSCGDFWYAFGSRTVTAEDSQTDYIDAVVWHAPLDRPLQWRQPDWDDDAAESRGGVPEELFPSSPAHRSFMGAACSTQGNTIAFGWDTQYGTEQAHDREGAFWVQNGEQWTREPPNKSLGGPGTQRVVSLDTIQESSLPSPPMAGPPPVRAKPPLVWRAVIAGGNGEGAQCYSARGLREEWTALGPRGMTGWTVEEVSTSAGALVAIATRAGSEPRRDRGHLAVFRSDDCSAWQEMPLPGRLRDAASLTSVKRIAGQWFATGWTYAESGASVPLLAAGATLHDLRELDLSELESSSSRGLVGLAEGRARLIGLGFDFSRHLDPDRNVSREDIVFRVELRTARAIRLPLVGIKYHNAHSNVEFGSD